MKKEEIKTPDFSMYDAILPAFQKLMRKELESNFMKGDRNLPNGWLSQKSNKVWLSELYYHVGKLQAALMNNDEKRIKENCADIANISMMVVDSKYNLLPDGITLPAPAKSAEEIFKNALKSFTEKYPFVNWLPFGRIKKEIIEMTYTAMEEYRQQGSGWGKLATIAPPEKWEKMYEHYKDLLTKDSARDFHLETIMKQGQPVTGMQWRDASDKPPREGYYFVKVPQKYSGMLPDQKAVAEYRKDFGFSIAVEKWLDESFSNHY